MAQAQRTPRAGPSKVARTALGEVSQAVNSTLNPETVLSTIVAKAVQLSGTEAGAIYVFAESATRTSSACYLRDGSGAD
jgi:GAF domain-containing protein